MTFTGHARAPVNIALVKYWGKRDLDLNLPARGSLSLTLAGLTTTTQVTLDEATPRDTLTLDGQEARPAALTTALRVVDLLRQRAGLTQLRATIHSANDFPTGAGLASSASGLAALTLATAAACHLDLPREELSTIARQGSGSAARSLLGGFVRWDAGQRDDGKDSRARQLFAPDHWDLRVVVALVSSQKKTTSSTEGMEHTRRTSPYHQAFLDTVDADLEEAEAAIAARDLARLGRVAERSCLRMHADMLAADPPLSYLRPESWRVIDTVRRLQGEGVPVFFTADAGPNVKLFCLPEALARVRSAIGELGELLEDTLEARVGPGAELIP